jgi:hypothetical protein
MNGPRVPRSWDRVVLLVALAAPPLLVQQGAAGTSGRGQGAVALLTALAGLFLLHRVVDDLGGSAVASWTILALAYGTFLFADMAGGPEALPHAASFALSALAVALAWRSRQDGFGLMPALALLAAVAIPYAAARVMPIPRLSRFGDTLFASPGGFLYWTPILWLGFLGFWPLVRREGRWVARPVLVVAAIILAATSAGPSGSFFAGGRFHAALPLLGLGLGAAFAWLRDAVARRPMIPLAAAGSALVIWNFLFMEQYRTDRIPRDFPVSFAQVTETNAAILARVTGSPLAWPANWLFAWRHGVPAAKYDVVVGQSLLGGEGPGGAIVIGDDRVDPALLAEGWGPRKSCEGGVCREVLGAARLLAPLDSPGPMRLTVRAAGAGTLALRVNGVAIAEFPLAERLADLTAPAVVGPWRPGLNQVVLECEPPGKAAVERLVFGPGEGAP